MFLKGLILIWVLTVWVEAVGVEESFLMDLPFAIPSWVERDLMCPRDYCGLIVIAVDDLDSKHRQSPVHHNLVDPKQLSVHCRHCSVEKFYEQHF